MLITVIALFVAIPVGLAAAIYLSEYASVRVRSFFKPVLEILVGIPTVVFGFFALTFMTPLLRSIFGSQVGFFNALSAGMVVGLLIVPLVSSLSTSPPGAAGSPWSVFRRPAPRTTPRRAQAVASTSTFSRT